MDSLVNFVLDSEGKDAVASVNFIDKQDIQKLNKKYRNIDKPTDVLSFESDIEGDLGDIFICREVAQENAKKFNTTLDKEINLLVVHGLLHLCGYDHIEDEDAEVMEAREEELLDAWESKNV